MSKKQVWHRILESKEDLIEGRVQTVVVGTKQLAVSHYEGKICAIDNACPHQGGPLGEGSIENGILRCPWHGWDFHPCTGKAPGFDDGVASYPVEERSDGIYVGLEDESSQEKNLSDIMVRTMTNWGVDTVFGIVGHSNLGMADALKREAENGRLKYIGVRHEGAGAFAASAYGKLSGKPAACFSIAGPGATNMFTGLWDAKVDRAPLLALTGQVATQVIGTGNFQEVDLVQAFGSVANFNHRIQKDSKHAELMSLAVKHALLDRDVSHLTFPDEIQTEISEEKALSPDGRLPDSRFTPSTESIAKARYLLEQSLRPVLVVGHGARFDMESIIEFSERLNAPILTTFKAKGIIPDAHPLACGVLGRSGTPIASWFMNESDLLIVLGASFSNHTGITAKKPTIQIDSDPKSLAKFHPIDAPILGDIKSSIGELKKDISANSNRADQRPEIKKRWQIWRDEKANRRLEYNGTGLASAFIFEELSNLAPEDAVICVDVGNNAYSLGRYFESKNNSFLMSGYLGSIGFALPAAMGAWAATAGKRPIIAVAGDGGFAQYMAELTTSVKYGMDIKVILLNNCELGKISKEQRSGGFDVFATELVNPDFALFANSCGALGIKVDKQSDLKSGLEEILNHNGTALLEIIADVNLI
ncbi:MAG: thiamine pyrophosphate-binding protein [Bacteroidales bacterium]|nr:thiamine pyrophosphate-binding protein [Bacteroidales bacterium]